jgi:hypothetical protein
MSRRDWFAALTAANLAGAVATSAVAFEAEEIVRQTLGVADELIEALRARAGLNVPEAALALPELTPAEGEAPARRNGRGKVTV